MTRKNARELAVHLIYGADCSADDLKQLIAERLDDDYVAALAEESDVYEKPADEAQKAYITAAVLGVSERKEELENYISEFSVGWSVNRISKLDRAILKLAMYEALYTDDVPCNVAIHEAVQIARKFDDKATVSFINGVLGSFARKYITGETNADTGI